MFDLSGRKALITGASGGIGSAIAEALARQGADVVLSGTRQGTLDETATSISSVAKGRVQVIAANLSEAGEAENLAKKAQEAMGGIDILINNAGITRDGLMMRMKDEDWDMVMAVNLTSAMRLTRGVMRGMIKSGWGRIIQISSVVGYTGNPGQANYAASKAGITGFTKALAAEIATRGVTVNVIAPGFIETPMTEALSDEQKEKLQGHIPVGRLGTPQDVASGAVYLSSDEASYITGATLHINGGMAMI